MSTTEELFKLRTNDFTSNIAAAKSVMEKHSDQFAPLLELCPGLDIVFGHMLILRLGFSVKDVSWTSEMKEWTETDCKNVGRSMAIFMRMVQTSEASVDAWRKHYPQLGNLFQVDGFNDFIFVMASNLLRNNKYGMIFRVSVGAALSTLDRATDIYVISTYYQSDKLVGQAHALLAMISTNMFFQILAVLGVYQKKSWGRKLKEVLICLLFLRPAVDAFRVSTNHEDEGATIELATESIPGCVLQVYVWLNSPEEAGTFALGSIGISAATTGFSSAIIAYDMDVDVPHRRNQPKFYGYIPDDNGARGRCFVLMTMISALHNLSRSVGCALLAAVGNKGLILYFADGEMLLYLIFKLARG